MDSSSTETQFWTLCRPGKLMHSLGMQWKSLHFPGSQIYDTAIATDIENRHQRKICIYDFKLRQTRVPESAQPILKRLSIEKSNYQSNVEYPRLSIAECRRQSLEDDAEICFSKEG